MQEAVDARLLVDWESKVRQYFADATGRHPGSQSNARHAEEQLQICELKRQIMKRSWKKSR